MPNNRKGFCVKINIINERLAQVIINWPKKKRKQLKNPMNIWKEYYRKYKK